MSDTETETITVADISAGAGGNDEEPGSEVALPAVEILTGRGFITGKSGSGKSNTASVVVEKLLSANFPVLVVDTDGEYYGLKEQFELLHAGADDECDIQVSPEHAEKLATLALEQNVPIILDVSGYLDESEGKKLLLETTRHLFAKEKKLKKPFLMLVEEVHEYIPEGGGMDEAGKMLIKVGKRGRKHGLGIVGISQRPADVKKDFITQCDWLVWHRLTWGNDTKVVGRILGSKYADAVEDLSDGEGFLMTDWSESIRRVQFHRKTTFDAGATPGLDDFERPDLKSVSGDLVDELRTISDERERRESELARLRQELDKKDRKIRELERQLEEARDLSRMAEQFTQAMFQRAEAPYRGGAGRNLRRPEEKQAALEEYNRVVEDADGDVDEATVREAAEAATEAAESASDTADAADGSDTDAEVTAAEGDRDDEVTAVDGDAPPWAFGAEAATDARASDHDPDRDRDVPTPAGDQRAVVDRLTAYIDDLDPVSRRMLAHYRESGPADPVDAHVAAGETGDQHLAYSRNRPLRTAGFVTHVGRGRYDYHLPELVREEYADRLDDDEFAATVAAIERAFRPSEAAADPAGDESAGSESTSGAASDVDAVTEAGADADFDADESGLSDAVTDLIGDRSDP